MRNRRDRRLLLQENDSREPLHVDPRRARSAEATWRAGGGAGVACAGLIAVKRHRSSSAATDFPDLKTECRKKCLGLAKLLGVLPSYHGVRRSRRKLVWLMVFSADRDLLVPKTVAVVLAFAEEARLEPHSPGRRRPSNETLDSPVRYYVGSGHLRSG
jgi:hypothetical protein